MKKSYNPISDVRNETVDLTKRLYRNISDAAHQLDEIRGGARCVADLFAPAADAQRARLRDACERLLLHVADAGPTGAVTAHAQTRKAEELLWRKAYYDVVATAKRIRKGSNSNNEWQPDEMALVHHHITAGIGLYHHLLWRLQSECSLAIKGIVDGLVFFPDEGLKKGRAGAGGGHGGGATNGVDKMASGADEGGRGSGAAGGGLEWAELMGHRCLIYLGDLCRYLVDLQPGWDYGLASHYYTQALLWKPEAGLPHNQLGTMAGTQNYSLDAVYHYMRCMCCLQTFEGTEGNLNQLLDKSAHLLEANCALARTVARLLYCVRTWFCNKPPKMAMHKVCDDLIVDLRECLHATEDVELLEESDDIEKFAMVKRINEKPTRMTEEMLFKSVAIVLMCLHNLNKKGFLFGIVLSTLPQTSIGSPLAAVRYIVSREVDTCLIYKVQVLQHVRSRQLKPTIPPYIRNSELSRGVSLQLSVIAQVLHEILLKVESVLPPPPTPPPVTNGLANRRRRRRRRKHRMSSDDGSSELSEGEEVLYVSDTDSDASEEKLIFDQNSSDSDEELNGKTANGANSADEEDIVTRGENSSKSHHYRDNLTFQHLHRLSQQGFLLQTIKICFDWLGGNVDTLKACGQTCKLFLDHAVSFFNHLLQVPFAFDSNNDENLVSNNSDRIMISDDLLPLPLPEDVCLRDLPPLVTAQQGIDWKKGLQANISSEEETYLRIYRLLTVGVRLAKDDSCDCGWSFIGQRKWFVVDDDTKNRKRPLPTATARHNRHRNHKSKSMAPTVLVTSRKLLKKNNNNNMQNSSNNQMACNGNSGDQEKKLVNSQENGVAVGNAANDAKLKQHNKLMANMGQLWLRAEVKELETKVKRSAQHQHLPPYLVLDSEALTAHFALTKQLVMSKKFIVLIPSVVVSTLDEQKESGCVRETIRWLEGQFRHGNRFVRAQRPNEHLSLPLIKYPKKKDKEAWLFFQIVECCHFLSSQGGKDEGLVTLLTGSPTLLHSSNSTGFSPLGIASTAGINIEHIESFHSKWKSSSKSHG